MYLTTTLDSLPATTSNFSSLQTINLQRKPLPPLPIPQQRQQQSQYNIQRRDQQFTSRTQQQQQQQQQQQHQHKSSMQYYTDNNNNTTTKNSISQDVSLLEQVSVERASEFAAHMTCFLWFGDYLMDPQTPTSIIAPPPPPGGNGHRRYTEFKPRDAFKKFCKDVISATQVSNSVILLSLLYIHRMKINNPTIKGQNGSEYRTFTVALMLANKFLDDNTYTNKTWSEVTNIPVSEINTMEMEFLSSLDYELYVSEQQYFEWVRKMDSFVALGEDYNKHEDNNNASDCAMTVSHVQPVQYSSSQPSYLTSQSQSTQSSQSTSQSTQRQILVPVTTGFKRSAEQAFVDGMMVSPPKRTNLYPVYSSQQQQYTTQTIAYPTPPSSTGAYYNIPTTTSSMYTTSHSQQPQQFSVRAQQYTYPISNVYFTARRMQSNLNLINARYGSSGLPINNLSFPTTVV
jgi:hypothetical protein